MNDRKNTPIVNFSQFEFRPGFFGRACKVLLESLGDNPAASGVQGLWFAETGALNTIYCLHTSGMKELTAAFLALNEARVGHVVTRRFERAKFSPNFENLVGYEIYEIRLYTYEEQHVRPTVERWSTAIGQRSALSPLLFCGYGDTVPVCDFLTIWPYRNTAEREEVRARAIASKSWPPGALKGLMTQNSVLAKPLNFSPLR
jgi:hypothetical protein